MNTKQNNKDVCSYQAVKTDSGGNEDNSKYWYNNSSSNSSTIDNNDTHMTTVSSLQTIQKEKLM